MHSFVQDILIFDVPFIEGTDETVLVHPGHAAGERKKFPRGLNVGISGQIMPYRHHLVELAVLDRICSQSFRQAAQTVYDHTVYPEAMLLEPTHALQIARYRLVSDILAP